ncbi:MAG: hypothetical protein ACP5LT_00140 [Candidatus Kapaibacteriota bacterium]
MKTFKFFSALFIFIFAFYLFHSKVFAECQPCDYSKALLGINPQNSKFLWYFHFLNVFDSVTVETTYGEFQIVRDGDREKINLLIAPVFETNQWRVLGQDPSGEDTILTNLARTEPFVYQANSKLLFFRLLLAGISCSSNPPIEPNKNWGKDAAFWVGYPQVILDTSEWVVQLVDKQTGNVLTVLDSVGISTNYNTPIANVYGTSPKVANREVDLPDEFAGREVYLRISTRRFGPTPLGMWLYAEPSKFSLSSFYEYNTGECIIPWLNCDFNYKDFEVYFFGKLIEYLDGLVESRNRPISFEDLPSDNIWLAENKHLSDSLFSRYFDKFFLNDSNFVWIERSVGENYRKFENQEGIIKPKEEEGRISVFYDKNSKCIILNSTHKLSDCWVKVYNLIGRKIWESQHFDIFEGENRICLSQVGSQIVILQVQNSSNLNLLLTKVPLY